MLKRKGSILIITILATSLILTISLYTLSSINSQKQYLEINYKIIKGSSFKEREFLLTRAYNELILLPQNEIDIKTRLINNPNIIEDDLGKVYYDKEKDLICVENSISNENYLLSFYSYFDSKLSLKLDNTEFKLK